MVPSASPCVVIFGSAGAARMRAVLFAVLSASVGGATAADISLFQSDPVGQSSFNTGTSWTGGVAPTAGNNYFTGTFTLRTPSASSSDFTFAGDALTIDASGALRYMGLANSTPVITVNNLIMDGGLLINGANEIASGTSTLTVSGTMTVKSNSGLDLGIADSMTHNVVLNSTLTGTGGFYIGTSTVSGSINPAALVTINGNNSGFSGGFFISRNYTDKLGGTVTLNGTNATYPQIMSSATIRLGHANALGTGQLAIDAGTVDLNGLSPTIGSLAGTGGAVVNNGGGAVTLTVGNDNTNSTYSGTFRDRNSGAGTLALTKVGNGVLTLSGSNSYTGGTQLNAGVLAFGNTSALGTGTVTIGSGTLRAGVSGTVANPIAVNAARIDTNGNAVRLSGVISGSNGLTKAATLGTLTLAGDNTFTGNVVVDGTPGQVSVLVATRSTSLGTGTKTVTVTGFSQTLALDGSGGDITLGSNINYSFSNFTTQALWNLAGNNTVSGSIAMTVGGGDTIIRSDAGSLTLAGEIGVASFNIRNLALTGSAGGTVSGAVVNSTGTTVITKLGSGTWTLSGSNTYSGGTQINAGVLALGNGGALGTTGTISFGGGTLRFSSSNTTDYSSRFSTAASQAFSFDTSGQSVTLATGLSSSGGALTKLGSGTLTLSGNNTYSGGTQINAGVLALGNAGALGTTGTISFGGGTLQFSSSNTTDYSTRFSTAASQAFSFDTNGRSVTLATGLSSSGGTLTKLGSGTLTLSASNAYSAGTQINAGVLALGNTAGLGSGTVTFGGGLLQSAVTGTIANAIAVASGVSGTFDSQANANTLGGIISGSGMFAKTGSGTLTLSGNNTYSGGTQINAGILALGNAGALGTTGTISFGGGTLQFSGSNTTDYSTRFSTAASQAFRFDTNGQSVSLATGLSSSGGTLTKLGSGTLTLSASNAYSGGTQINAGVLAFTNMGALGTGTVTISSGTLRATMSGTVANPIATNAGRVDTNGNAVMLSGVISGSNGLTKAATSGTLTLAGDNTFTGNVTLDGAVTITPDSVLVVTRSTSLGTGAKTVSVAGYGKTLILDGSAGDITLGSNISFALSNEGGGDSKTLLNLVGNNTISGSIGMTSGGAGTIIQSDAGSLTLAGNIGSSTSLRPLTLRGSAGGTVSGNVTNGVGTVTLTKSGTGTWTLSGSNTYSGATTVSGGTLQIGAGGTTGSLNTASTIAVSSGATLAFSRSDTITQGSGFNSLISGSGNLAQLGSGTLVLNGANTYSGTTTLSAGVLNLGSAETAGTSGPLGRSTAAGSIVLSGGTLQYSSANGGYDYSSRFSTAANQRYNVDTNGQNVTWAANLTSSTGSITKLGTGTLTLNGNNTYSGGATVSLGRLTLGHANALGTGTATIGGGELDIATFAPSVAGFRITSGTLLGTGTLTSSAAFDIRAGSVLAKLGGSVGLTKSTTGTAVLAAANSFTGATAINAGLLEIAAAGSINSTSGITVNGSTAWLAYNSSTALSQSLTLTQGTLSGTGTINTAVAIGSGVFHSPGNSPGIQTVASEIWNPGGTYVWELNSLAGAAGTNWDQIAVTGLLDLDGLSTGDRFNLNLVTLTGSNTAGPLDIGYVPGSTFQYTIATFGSLTVPTGFATTANSDLSGLFTVNLGGWQGTQPNPAQISVRVNSTATGIDVVIVPEPGSLALAAAGLGAVGYVRWRRRRLARAGSTS